jgi:hypothetical protein
MPLPTSIQKAPSIRNGPHSHPQGKFPTAHRLVDGVCRHIGFLWTTTKRKETFFPQLLMQTSKRVNFSGTKSTTVLIRDEVSSYSVLSNWNSQSLSFPLPFSPKGSNENEILTSGQSLGRGGRGFNCFHSLGYGGTRAEHTPASSLACRPLDN